MSDLSAFDPDHFLDLGTDQEGSLVTIPVPVGEYMAIIEKVTPRPWSSNKNGIPMSGMAIDLQYDLDDAGVKEALGRPKVTVTQGIMLEMTEDSKSIDMSPGKNVNLNRVRDACGLNQKGVSFKFRDFQGKVVKVVIGHRPSDRPQDPPGTVFTQVNGVLKPR